MKRESPVQTIVKFIPLAVTVGTVVIALINALIFIRTNDDRQKMNEIDTQHQVLAKEIEGHEKSNDKDFQDLAKDIGEIKQDVKDIRQYLLGK